MHRLAARQSLPCRHRSPALSRRRRRFGLIGSLVVTAFVAELTSQPKCGPEGWRPGHRHGMAIPAHLAAVAVLQLTATVTARETAFTELS